MFANSRRVRIKARVAIALAAMTAPAAQAADTWTNAGGDANWNTPGNWLDNSVPQWSDAVTLPTPIPTAGQMISLASFNALPTASSLVVNDDYTLSDDRLQLSGTSIGVAPGKTLTINSVLGAAGVNKTGSGTLVLRGDNTGALSGQVAVTAGTLRVDCEANLGGVTDVSLGKTLEVDGTFTTAKTITPAIGGSATINVTAGNALTLTSALGANQYDLSKTGQGTLVLKQYSTRSASTFLMAGVLRMENYYAVGSRPISMGNAKLEVVNVRIVNDVSLGTESIIEGTGNAAVGYGTGAVAGFDIFPTFRTGSSASDVLEVPFAGGGTSNSLITIAGAGTVMLPRETTYPGRWNLTSGTLRARNAKSLGSGTSPLEMSPGTTLLMDSTPIFSKSVNVADGCTLRATTTTHWGTIHVAPGAHVTMGTIPSYGAAAIYSIGSGSAMTGGGSGSTVHVVGPGTVTLPISTGDYSGNWSVEAGRLRVTDSAGIANSTLTLNGGTVFLDGNFPSQTVLLGTAGGTLEVEPYHPRRFASVEGPGDLVVQITDNNYPLTLGRLRAGHVTQPAGTLVLDLFGAPAPIVNEVDSLTVGAAAKLDLYDNAVVDHSGDVGAWDGTSYTGLTKLIAQGRNGGAWNGSGGILTSLPDARNGLTSLGIATAAQAGYAGSTFGGVSVSATDALLMYTYAGDANLDGMISGDDYTAIDFAIQVPGASGWHNGDFNYDGLVSGDDYTIIDFNILAQGAPFSTVSGEVAGATAVPEAGGVGVLAIAGLAGRRRRRAVA